MWISSDSLPNASGLEGFGTEPHIAVLGGPRGDARRTELVPGLRFHDDGLPDITVPTLFVWSPEDVAIAREGAELTGRHVDAPYRF